jgi:hypothetical protein
MLTKRVRVRVRVSDPRVEKGAKSELRRIDLGEGSYLYQCPEALRPVSRVCPNAHQRLGSIHLPYYNTSLTIFGRYASYFRVYET